MTARQAITDLVNEGLFYREQGKGTFVSQRKITQQLRHRAGFTEDIRARGQRPGRKVISGEMHRADEATAEKLRIPLGTSIFRLQRLRLADGEPLAIELSQINFKGCEMLLEENLEQNSLYRVLETKYGISLMEADQDLEAGLAGNEEAQFLKISLGSPVLFTRRTTHTQPNTPIEHPQTPHPAPTTTSSTHIP